MWNSLNHSYQNVILCGKKSDIKNSYINVSYKFITSLLLINFKIEWQITSSNFNALFYKTTQQYILRIIFIHP